MLNFVVFDKKYGSGFGTRSGRPVIHGFTGSGSTSLDVLNQLIFECIDLHGR
jgi:hypothetical protein